MYKKDSPISKITPTTSIIYTELFQNQTQNLEDKTHSNITANNNNIIHTKNESTSIINNDSDDEEISIVYENTNKTTNITMNHNLNIHRFLKKNAKFQNIYLTNYIASKKIFLNEKSIILKKKPNQNPSYDILKMKK